MLRSSLNRESVDTAKLKLIADRINFTEKQFADFASGFASLSQKTLRLCDKHDELAKIFKFYAENEVYNRTFAEGFGNFSKALTILGDFKELEATRIDLKISSEFQQYEGSCKMAKEDLKVLFTLKEKEMHRKKQMDQIKHRNQRGYHKSHVALDGEIKKLKSEIGLITKKINSQIENFEKTKLKFSKEILLNFIKIEIKQHARAIEVLTAAYQDFLDIDEDKDFEDFKKIVHLHEKESGASSSIPKRRTSLISQSTTSLNTTNTMPDESVESSNEELPKRIRNSLKKMQSMDQALNEISSDGSETEPDEDTIVPQIKLKNYCEGVVVSSTDERSVTPVKSKTVYVVKSINGIYK